MQRNLYFGNHLLEIQYSRVLLHGSNSFFVFLKYIHFLFSIFS